jgi:taurine dioxygenase
MNQKIQTKILANSYVGEVTNFKIDIESVRLHRAEIQSLFLKHKVLVFRNQNISIDDFAEFGTLFGHAEEHHVRAMRHPKIATLTMLSNQVEKGRNDVMKYFGDGWHADSSYKEVTAAATMLHGIEIPFAGGDTLFANVELAYHDLPTHEKNFLQKLRLRHQYRWSPNRDDPWARWKFVGELERRDTPEIIHPLVKRHPETGAESLHIAPRIIGSVIGIENMEQTDSDRLIDSLMKHVTDDKYIYRHKWNPLDVIVWDNRSLLHSATTKDMPESSIRRLLRITTTGTTLLGVTPEAGITTVVPRTEFS